MSVSLAAAQLPLKFSATNSSGDIRPPNPPWQTLNAKEDSCSYLSIYYSDDISPLPVRWITKPGDNKSDPNLETMTYGLFSTCSKAMRSGVVKRGAKYLFFATHRGDRRVLTGYYRLRWYASAPQDPKDFCIAADKMRFLRTAIPLAEVDRRCKTNVNKWFRNMRLLTKGQTDLVVKLINELPDASQDYLAEIDRLERFNLRHGGYRYVAWKRSEKFSWESARDYFRAQKNDGVSASKNATASNRWQCNYCQGIVKNKALLKRCPECGTLGSLRGLS